jgi:hypothetical protein
MDAEQSEEFDAQLELASDGAREFDEKQELMLAWGGDAVLC